MQSVYVCTTPMIDQHWSDRGPEQWCVEVQSFVSLTALPAAAGWGANENRAIKQQPEECLHVMAIEHAAPNER